MIQTPLHLPCVPALTLALLLLASPQPGSAGPLALFGDQGTLRNRAALVPKAQPATKGDSTLRTASLFTGTKGRSLFAPAPPRAKPGTRAQTQGSIPALQVLPGPHANAVQRIRHLIGQAESRRHGYDAVQHGARIKPAKRPTDMTIAEIYKWIDDTPGQPHAIGRYQFIPPTLKRLVRDLGVATSARFSPRLQDQLADILLADAGLNQIRAGQISRHAFMNNLAKIWAGLPNSSGKSHYHGYAGNKASMTWTRFDAEMSRIFPG